MRLSEIWCYPVKSMQGGPVPSAELGALGMADDRRWAVREVHSGQVLSAKREPKLLTAAATIDGGQPVITIDGTPVDDLSDWLGRPVELVERGSVKGTFEINVDGLDPDSTVISFSGPDGTFFDLAHAHVLTTASLKAAAADVRRFRPTLVVEVDGDGFVEDGWVGQSLRAGSAELSVLMPTVRCVMTTRAQPGLERDLTVLQRLRDEHLTNLGVYAFVTTPGRVSVGDDVSVE